MKKIYLILISLFSGSLLFAQVKTQREVLSQAAVQRKIQENENQQKAFKLAKEKNWSLTINGRNGSIAMLVGVDEAGYPMYLQTENNTDAAATTRANTLWPGGVTGLNLSGNTAAFKGKIGIWDGGAVLSSHVELTGRVTQKDAPSSVSNHSTHVAGTMIATGINPVAKGMAFQAQELIAYDFNNDGSEMLTEAGNLYLSNHSYGSISGWSFNQTASRWEFWGRAGENEDFKFGYYSSAAQLWDSIAFNAPFYLIVKSAGNNRNDNGPAVGSPYFRFDAGGNMVAAGNRPAGISDNNSFDIISTYGTAKNILTVGAINAIPNGYTKPQDAVMSAFSSWGPTDDGRIKPDIVANGVGLVSTTGSGTNAYGTSSGTSMSSPNVTGSLFLLQEYYARLKSGSVMRAATLKGLAIHTADEAGDADGPDYSFGWGVLNVQRGAAVITNAGNRHLIDERVLINGQTYTTNVVASGEGKLVATISWTDPKASFRSSADPAALNDPTPKLVNDLDIRIKRGANTSFPWKLNPAAPSLPATRGDNNLDNIEQVVVDSVVPGVTYTIEITHKGTLERAQQAYSLIISGIGGTVYCNSAATSSAGGRIDSVSFGGITRKNPAGCTTYTNNTTITAEVEPNQTLPLFVRLNSCDASSAGKIVKVYIDYNNDGDFLDAGENIATSGTITGDGNFTTNITTPGNITVGNFSLLRVVMVETTDASTVSACGTYTRGETQDFRIRFIQPKKEMSTLALLDPVSSTCALTTNSVTIRIRNNGTETQTNIPVTAVVKNGATTIATLNGTITDAVGAGATADFTFTNSFTTLPGITYTVTATVNLSGDQSPANNSADYNFSTQALATLNGTARICGTNVILNVPGASVNSDYFWFDSPAATNPISTNPSGTFTHTSTNGRYYLSNALRSKVGAVDKSIASAGSYQTPGGFLMNFTTTTPLIIETAKVYTSAAGNITASVADVSGGAGASVIVSVPQTNTTGSTTNDPADVGTRVRLNLPVTTAGNKTLTGTASNGATIFRNNSTITPTYPFNSLGNVMSITGNAQTTPGSFYYYFYDMEIRTTRGCNYDKTEIIATTASTPTITVNGNNLASSSTTGNQWFKDGVAISGANGQNYNAAASGNGVYTVQVTDANGCTMTSAGTNFVVSAIAVVSSEEIGLQVSPNPSKGNFVIKFRVVNRAPLHISLNTTEGNTAMSKSYGNFSGSFNEQYQAGKLAAGTYILRVQHGNKVYKEKVVIVR